MGWLQADDEQSFLSMMAKLGHTVTLWRASGVILSELLQIACLLAWGVHVTLGRGSIG